MRKIVIVGAIALAILGMGASAQAASSILTTKHNLASSGPGTIKATVEKPICEFCHAPHRPGQSAPRWNRELSEVVYTTYHSSTLKAAVGQPNGASKLCLSCHDGTIALGKLKSEKNIVPFTSATMPPGKTRLGVDLSDDHPVSFTYDQNLAARNGQLEFPPLRKPVKLDKFGQVQCTSCHDPHDNTYGKFLVMDNTASALCVICHRVRGWQLTAHRNSNASWNGGNPNPWFHSNNKTVSSNGCENCHNPHTAGGREWLLNYNAEEDNCYPCHNGNVASKNIRKEFEKPYRHPIGISRGIHKPNEDPLWTSRHVECDDCHNPHVSNSMPADPPRAPGSLAELSGVTSAGSPIRPLQFEYELCYRCHADNAGTKAPTVVRWVFEKNLRQLFKPSNASYHPIEAPGKNPNVPSLLVPYTTSSLLYCTSCHNNDSGTRAGGNGPNGPHGSTWRPLLEKQVATMDLTMESPQVYALCYKCHNRNNILADQSFSKHKKHIVDFQAPCTACHDPHGVVSASHLINFDKTIVFPDEKGNLRYEARGRFAGACYLKCHNASHSPRAYP